MRVMMILIKMMVFMMKLTIPPPFRLYFDVEIYMAYSGNPLYWADCLKQYMKSEKEKYYSFFTSDLIK